MEHNRDISSSGYVFNIQKYSLHDGPGIRTVVFLKGCHLRCRWCSNPESQLLKPEISYSKEKCIHCIECMDKCDKKAINIINSKKANKKQIIIDRNKCDNCGECSKICPSKALTIYGELTNYKEVVDIVETDMDFYSKSQGGLTISGGEPLLQFEFTKSILKEAKSRRIHTAIETCGYGKWSDLKEIASFLDYIIFDIKSMNDEKHKEYTGASNKLILDNFIKLCDEFPTLKKLVRTPVIPGFNDNIKDIQNIREFIKEKSNIKYELLSYHRLGKIKYENLGREYLMGDAKLDDSIIKDLELKI